MAITPLQTTTGINTGTGATATKPAAFYDKVLLKILRQRDWGHTQFAQERPMPRNYGDTVNFRRIQKLGPALTPLTEGVTPDGDVASITAISATTKQYGKPMYFSDVVNFQLIDPIVTEYSVEQGHAAKETLDQLVREELNGGTQVMYANSRVSRVTLAAGDKPTIDNFRKMRLVMKKNHVPTINGKYVVLITPEIAFDLMDDAKFLKAYEIGQNNKPLIEGEIADVYGIKFIEVVNAKVFTGAGAAGVNVHSSIMLGKDAYGITKIKGEGDVKAIVKALGSAGTEDPLDQRQSIAWKVNAFVAKRLMEEAIYRYESVPTNA
jgi:N4-gp56 family major capsid protein